MIDQNVCADISNEFDWNVIVFDVDSSSSSHTDNRKNIFLVLDQGATDDIDGSIGVAEKKFSINFRKGTKKKKCLIVHYNGDNSYLLVNRKKSISIKQVIKMSTFHRIYNKFDYVESEEVSLKENVSDFSVDYDVIDKSDILNIHKYLRANNNIK